MAKVPLTPEQADALLKKLSTDDAFRTLFQQDIEAAFKQLPGSPPPPGDLEEGCCLRPLKLAPANKIADAQKAIAENLAGKGTFQPHMLEA